MYKFLYGVPDSWAPVAAFPKPAKIEPPPAPLPMPAAADDLATIMAKRLELSKQMKATGSGRLSTMLTDDTGYSGDRLGVR
jgi:hypothetical protein